MWEEAEDVVAFAVAGRAWSDPLDDAGVIAAEHDWKLVVHHPPEHSACDRGINGVDRGGVDAHEHLVPARRRRRKVVSHHRGCVEALENSTSHVPRSFLGGAAPSADGSSGDDYFTVRRCDPCLAHTLPPIHKAERKIVRAQ